MKDANKLLGQAKELDAEEFCNRVHSLASSAGKPEPVVIDRKYKLQDRYSLAYSVLYSLLHKERHYGVKEKEEKNETAIIVTPENNYYALLGVNENSSQEEIGSAYKNKSKAIQIDVLEQRLRAQGLSDSEIKIRLQKAQRDFEEIQEAYEGIGNEQNRKYYDEFRKKFGEDKSQKSKPKTENFQNYEVLGVGPNPTQLEIRDAYRKKVKELHPDSYLSQLGKRREDITPEELKILNEREEKLKDVNTAYKEVFNQEELSREIKEVKEIEKKSKASENNIVIETNPTSPESDVSKKELKKTEKYRETVENAGFINITPEETAELKSLGVLSENTTSSEASANITTAMNLHTKGVSADKFSETIDIAVDTNTLTKNQGKSLQGAAYTLKALEINNPELTKSLNEGNKNPEVSIFQIPANTPSQSNQIVLQSQGGPEGFLQPLFEGVLDKGKDILEEKAEKAIVTGLEKRGISLVSKTAAKSASKKIATEAIKKGGEIAIKQGAKVAAKAGLKTGIKAALIAAGAPTGGSSLLIWLAMEVGERLLKAATKLIGGLLKFVTGKEDLKSQIKELAGIGFAFFLATGMIVPAIISGGVFISSLSATSIIGGVSGVFHGIIYVIAEAAIAITKPFLISSFVLIFLVTFIIIIMNNSAFIVPKGGFGYIGGSLPTATYLPGGIVARCEEEQAGADITDQLAGRINGGVVNFLPTEANTNPWCIVPQMIILHSSAGYDNKDGSQRTYETLVSRNLACQLASDTDDVLLMQPFYERMVTMAWCANSADSYGISIEISGEVPTPNPYYVECNPVNNLIFTNPPPHPCLPENEYTFDAVCKVMQQYDIPWCQVMTHDDVPDATHTDPVGKEWVQYFYDRLRNSCPTDNDSRC